MKETRFKDTEIGRIPEDWSIEPIGNIATVCGGGTPSTHNSRYWNGDINWFTPSEILEEGGYVSNSKRKITQEGLANSSAKMLPQGSILLTTRATIGNRAIAAVPLCTNQGFQSLIPKINNIYLYYIIGTVRNEMISNASGSTFLELSSKKLAAIKVSIPISKDEQARIAAALTSIDNLITSLDKLIEKKKNIKQGAMQQLLTGKKRLKGFSEPWVKSTLGSFCSIIMGQSPSSLFYNEDRVGLPLIQGNADIDNRKTIVRYYTSQITKTCNSGDIIMSVRAPVGAVGKASYKSCLGRGVCAMKSNNDFLYHYLVFIEDKWGQFSKGSTFDSVNIDDLKKIRLVVPSSEDEQVAISILLSSMDEEINSLNKKLAKYTAIKQGMMQQLLTGKIRLV